MLQFCIPHPPRALHLVSFLVSALSYLLLYTAAPALTLFDSSPRLVPASPGLIPLLRWDSFHFSHIAQSGYVYEHEWAFFPGASIVIWALHSSSLVLLFLVTAVTCDTTRTLYELSLHHFKSPSLAYISALLSLLSSSPVTVRLAPYSEPFYTYLSYKGMFYCVRKRWFLATIMFTVASSFRSNGFLLAGYILWEMLAQPLLAREKVTIVRLGKALSFTSLVFVPFAYHNYAAYTVFCQQSATEHIPQWCSRLFPSVYAHVQARYWNIGFFHYWTFSQLPNFIISMPILVLIVTYVLAFMRHHLVPSSLLAAKDETLTPFYDIALLPHVIHTVILSLMLLTNAHIQIVLRLAPSLPLVYWSAARLVLAIPSWARCWVIWSTIWGAMSIILWLVFLPPA
ncbi:hypothetical protein AX17_005750 [Amanita inopinata Kibby_2008]|nr:hypothetical protein AX17_005750 [Amanita inopinata Kibby_2008]